MSDSSPPPQPSTLRALLPTILIMMLGAFGGVLMSSTYIYLIEQAVCRTHWQLYEPERHLQVMNGGLIDEDSCKVPEIEVKVASIFGIYVALCYVPAFFLAGPYMEISSILGKRMMIFMNLISYAFSGVYFVGVCYFNQTFDIRWIYLVPFFDLLGGGAVILSTVVYTLISENVAPKDLSQVLYQLSAAQLLMSFLGMTVSSFTLRRNIWLQCILAIACSFILLPIALLLPESASRSPSKIVSLGVESDNDPIETPLKPTLSPSSTNETTSLLSISYLEPTTKKAALPKPKPQKPQLIPTVLVALRSHHTHTFSLLNRIINSSPFTHLTLLTYLLYTLFAGIRIIFTQWSSLTYSWLYAEVATLNSFEMIVSGLVLLSLPFVSLFLSRQTSIFGSAASVDLFIIQTSLTFCALGMVLMAFAPTRATYVAALSVFTLGSGTKDALRSYVTGKVRKDEIENLYLGIGMVQMVGGVVATVGWSALLARVLEAGWWVQRVPLLGGAVGVGGMVGIVWVLGRVEGIGKGDISEEGEEG